MALSDADKYRVIFALGLPGESLTPTSVEFNSIIRDRLSINNTHIEDRIVQILDDVDAIKLQLKASPKNANLKRIGDIELDTDKSHLLIKKELGRLLDELSKILVLPNRGSGSKNVGVVL